MLMPLNHKKLFSEQGFTLLELLVALSIFSILSVMAYGGLQTVISTKNSTQQAADRIAEVQLAMTRISSDLRQALPRKIRSEHGDFLHAMQSSQNSDEAMAWTRGGYRNPAQLKRSNIQRVGYKLKEKNLVRITWPVLDRAQDTESMETEILTKLESIEWRFLNDVDEWLSTWPEEGEKAEFNPLPKAVELTFELNDWGKIRRLILLDNTQ